MDTHSVTKEKNTEYFLGYRIATILFFLFIFQVRIYSQEKSVLERFDYKGDIIFQGFFLARDLPLERSPDRICPTPFGEEDNKVKSRCKEESDYYRIRFRLNLAFRPSPYVDILYGLEVGFLTFGDDNPNRSGPGSGGGGSGRTNLETRELLLKLKNKKDSVSLNLGIFSFNTPRGIVIASSGGGGKFIFDAPALNSGFEAIYIRSQDHSRVDDDSNGFSDENFSDINLGIVKWKFSGIPNLRTELYGVYKQDDNPGFDDPTENNRETSRIFWGGLHLQLRSGRLKFILHGIGNWGSFHRPYEPTLSPEYKPGSSQWLEAIFEQSRLFREAGLLPDMRKKYKVDAGAGQMEIAFRMTDRVELKGVIAGGSGRLGTEPDGSSVELRRDQFRTAESHFQFSDIAVDTSGGYTLFPGGRLTGIVERGLILKTELLGNLQGELGYFNISFYRSPTIDENIYYRRHFNVEKTSAYFGEEWNAALTWRAFSGLTIAIRVAHFNAGVGYKILKDIEYGDSIFESSFSIKQTF